MLTAEILLKSSWGIVSSLVLFFLAGWLSFKVKKGASFQNHFERVFWYLFVGLLQVLSVYAMVRTGLQTILLPVPFLLLLFISKRTYSIQSESRPVGARRVFLFLSATVAVFLGYYLQAYISWDHSYIRFASGDHSYYARVAEYLNITGKENSTLEYLYTERFNVTPYHYGDIWFCAFAGWIARLKTEFALILIVYPLLALIFTVGLSGFLVKKFPGAGAHSWVFITIMALFLSGFASFFPSFILKADVFPQSAAGYPKTLWISCFLIASFILVTNRDLIALLIFIAIAGLSFINVFPSLICAVVLWGLLAGRFKIIEWKKLLPGTLVLLFALGYLFLFYKLLTVTSAAVVESGQGISALINLKTIKTGFNILIGGIFQFSILVPFLALFLIAALSFYKKDKIAFVKSLLIPEVLWGGVLAISGLLSWAVLYVFTSEAVQFFHNIFIPLSAIFIGSLVFWIFIHKGFLTIKFVTVTLLFLALTKNLVFDFHVDQMSYKEWLALRHFLRDAQKNIFATYKDQSEFTTIFQKNTRFAQALPVLNYMYAPYINESLNTPFLQVDPGSQYKGVEASLISVSSFDFYAKNIRREEVPMQAEKLMQDFIEHQDIDYIMVSEKAVLPSFVPSLATDSLILPDANWRVFKLRKDSLFEGRVRKTDSTYNTVHPSL